MQFTLPNLCFVSFPGKLNRDHERKELSQLLPQTVVGVLIDKRGESCGWRDRRRVANQRRRKSLRLSMSCKNTPTRFYVHKTAKTVLFVQNDSLQTACRHDSLIIA